MCRIYDAGSEALEKLKEFYEHIAELPLSNPIFSWYRLNADKVHIACIDDEVRICKAEDEESEEFIEGTTMKDIHDNLIDQALDNNN